MKKTLACLFGVLFCAAATAAPTWPDLVVHLHKSGKAFLVDPATVSMVADLGIGSGCMGQTAFTPDGRFAYISNAKDGNLFMLDMSSFEVIGEVETGKSPRGRQVLNAWTNVFEELPRD